MASTAKQRQPRLRASCDGCFLAKVKCSKARPICSRCLACGADCNYSPSSRAGKPKSDHRHASKSSSHAGHDYHPTSQVLHLNTSAVTAIAASLSPISDKPFLYAAPSTPAVAAPNLWQTPCSSFDGSSSNFPGSNLYAVSLPWTPPADLPADLSAASLRAMSISSHSRSQSFDFSLPATPTPGLSWIDGSMVDMMPYGAQALPTPVSIDAAPSANYFPSPVATPSCDGRGDCTCFAGCLDALQVLHSAASPGPGTPPFDVVLALNRLAVEGCAGLLACAQCMGRADGQTALLLLATLLGRVVSFYRSAWQAHLEDPGVYVHAASGACEPGSSPPHSAGIGVSLGAYQLQGEDGRWLELQILNRELDKLQDVHAQLEQACGRLAEGAEMAMAVAAYVGQALSSTRELVRHKGARA